MKTLLISILILISFSSKAGNIWWVNYTKQQLFDAVPQKISNYKKEDFDFYSWTDEDLDAVIMVVYKENEPLPVSTIISSTKVLAIQHLFNLFNKNCVIVSETEWKVYFENKVISINYNYKVDDENTAFIIRYIK